MFSNCFHKTTRIPVISTAVPRHRWTELVIVSLGFEYEYYAPFALMQVSEDFEARCVS